MTFNRNNFIVMNGSRLFTAKEVADLIREYEGDARKERERVLLKLLDEMGSIDGYSGKGAKNGYLVCDDDVKEIISRIRKGAP
jgi:hypothetical protein